MISTLLGESVAILVDSHVEELLIKPLPSGHVYFHFQFTTKWDESLDQPDSFKHYGLFPKSLGDVLTTYKVQELHLSQTQGLWHHDKWGYPVTSAPPGAELWVWFQPTITNIDETWSELVNALSGHFCSSLNFLDSKSTVAPRWSFRPHGVASEGYSSFSRFIRYGALPREIVCTENLTPWKKLLPCNTKVGLGSLFKAIKLYDANYHSLGLHVRPVCRNSECKETSIELSQSLSVVFDPVTSNWSLKKIFGDFLSSRCPLTTSSKIFVDITSNLPDPIFTLSPEADSIKTVKRGDDTRQYAVYDIGLQTANGRVFNIASRYDKPLEYTDIVKPPVSAQRFITGYGLEKGGVTSLIYNNLDSNLTVIYMETLPWFTRFFYKSLTLSNQGTLVQPYKINYIPGKDRGRPYHLEIVFRLRANSVTKISYDFERAFLKWTEYPPDANHGFYIGSAILSTVLPTSVNYTTPPQYSTVLENSFKDDSESYFLRLHTETLLVSLPTPDFSMPYNVICLACTVVAIAFGSIHNLTTRRFTLLDPSKKKGILAKIKGLFKRS
ncbi:hypothetical protein LOTGIDRAFT_128945 [Lottia gigantea]|uniref:GPI transamidase component PIG-T n=1 Tax=Lottia gigantea TaxID=225164 RepID=V3ZZT8_LOTGI|nr:hypothetical protein LOTGIDRAFT_128945 [Lottia gigantea]ESO86516.1 hypothetical protein LOTGIDRAFT_128945 [Lottia gigantea]